MFPFSHSLPEIAPLNDQNGLFPKISSIRIEPLVSVMVAFRKASLKKFQAFHQERCASAVEVMIMLQGYAGYNQLNVDYDHCTSLTSKNSLFNS